MIRIKKAYSKLPKKIKNQIEAAYLFFVNNFKRFRWIPKNIFISFFLFYFIKNKIKNLNFFEQKFNSQNGEDGIIKVIFKKIGTTNKFCVEFGIGITEGNSIYLKKNGWDCLWMDGVGDGHRIKKEYITAENINDVFTKYNVPKVFDLLSIDIDSNDYWVWKAIQNYSPRVVVIEYNSSIPPTASKTIMYDPNVSWKGTDYFGASLLALKNLGESKGYSLVACDNRGVNAFFVRNDLIGGNFEIKTIKEIYKQPNYGKNGHPKDDRVMIDV